MAVAPHPVAPAPPPAPSAPSPSTTTEAPWTPTPGAARLLRQQRQRQESWRALGLPPRLRDCRLATYPVPASGPLAKVQAWLDGGASGLLLHGEAGRGKTGLALGALRELMADDGRNVAFAVVPELLDDLRAASRPDSEVDCDTLLGRYKRKPVLVLDDIGAERVTDFARERLYLLVHARHSDPKLLTIFTSNLAPSALEDRLGERIAWRIIEMSEVVKVDGPNLRDRR